MDSTFLNVARGNHWSTYMTLRMDEGHVHRFASDYTYVEVGMRKIIDADEKEVEKISRNQAVVIEAPCTVKPVRLYKVMVSVNPELANYANVPLQFLIDWQGETAAAQKVQVVAHFRKDMEVGKLPWVFRMYLIS